MLTRERSMGLKIFPFQSIFMNLFEIKRQPDYAQQFKAKPLIAKNLCEKVETFEATSKELKLKP